MFSESLVVEKRINDAYVTTALLTQGAIISVLDKKGNEGFRKLIASLGGDEDRADAEPRGHEKVPIRGPRDARVPPRPSRESTGAPKKQRTKGDLLG